jgi:ParB-like chromosome segregation protein Spo0J
MENDLKKSSTATDETNGHRPALREEFPLHPLTARLPSMSPEEYARLKEDIRTHGVRLPVVTLEHQILDGRHRAQACRELGIACPTVEAAGDPAALVASLNLHRRHLAPDQIAAIHVLLTDGLAKRPEPEPHVRLEARRVGKAAAEVAQKLGVSRATVERVGQVKRKAPEKMKDIAAGTTKAVTVLREVKGASARTAATSKSETPAMAPPVRPAAPSPAPAPVRASLENAALGVHKFSDKRDVQKELRLVLHRAQVLAQRYHRQFEDLASFYGHVAGAFADGSIKRPVKKGYAR